MIEENPTLFGKILRGELPCDQVYEDDHCVAFHDINPAAPIHILIIPKRHIVNLLSVQDDDAVILGQMMLAASKIAHKLDLEEDGFRVIINNGEGVGQTVFHLHMHLLAGRAFSWPPG